MRAGVLVVTGFICAACSVVGALELDVPVGDDIQAAIDRVTAVPGGGAVTLKSGTHVIDVPLRMKSNVTIRGEGTLASRLRTTRDIKMITAHTNGLANLSVKNLVLVGSNAPHGGGIHLVSYRKDHTNISLSGVHVFETGWGVHIKGVRDVTIENCNFSRNGTAESKGYAHNLYLRRCYSATVTNSVFNHCISANGINISYSTDIRVVDCRVIGNHFRGIRAADSDGFLVHDCVIANNGTVGLLANTEKVVTKNIDWQNNHVFANGAQGIYARRGATGVCKDNNAYGNRKGNYELPGSVSQSGNVSAAVKDSHK